jgi:perosamine synthetase
MSVQKPDVFVPAFPTVRPEMLLRRGTALTDYPFSAPSARYFYFARNAIWLVVKTLGLEGGVVLVPAYHHGVEIEALLDAGALVRFYRVGPRWDADLEDVARKIGPETRALYLTHFGGFPGPVREMKALAEKHGLPLIEDCALSLFSADGDLPLGVTGDVAVFCLYKVLAVPDGGILVSNGPESTLPGPAGARPSPPLVSTLSALASSMLRNVALRGGKPGRMLRRLALGLGKRALSASKVTPVLTGTQHFNRDHAKLGLSRLTRHLLRAQDVPAIVARRRRNYLFLLECLRDLSPPLFETLPAGVVPLCYPMRVEDNRRVMEQLVARGIEAVDFWREGHPSCDISEFPDVARLRTSVVEVPCHQDVTLETLAKVATAIREVLTAQPGRVQVGVEPARRPLAIPTVAR